MSRNRHWTLLTVALGLALVAIRLGFWQLDRLSSRRTANTQLQLARSLPPIDLGGDSASAGRRVTATGTFETTCALLLRSRVHRAAPGLHVVSPFRVETSGTVIWVLRGFVAAADGVHPDVVPPPTPGLVTIRGELQPLPATDDRGRPAVSDGDTTWQRMDVTMAAERRPDAMAVLLYMEGDSSGPDQLATVEPPVLDNGPHLSYALQWFAIALAILVFSGYVIRKPSGRERAPPAAAP